MDDENSIILRILDWLWIGLIAVLGVAFKRINDLRDCQSSMATQEEHANALVLIGKVEGRVTEVEKESDSNHKVMSALHRELKEQFQRSDERNERTHSAMMQRIDNNHKALMSELHAIESRLNGNYVKK